jgi:DNA repair protein RadC
MTIETLFGQEEIPSKPRSIKFKQIKAVYETLTVEEEVSNYLSPHMRYTSPEQVNQIFQFLRNETKEYFYTLHLDGKNRIICLDMVSLGTLNQSLCHPREIFKTALLSNAAAIILVHQHPTGDPSPSREDLEITRRLKEVGELIGICIIDHIIIGDSYLSFASQGLL